MVNSLYGVIKDSALKTLVNGDLYKGERPTESDKEDIVLVPLVVSGSDKQIGICNVNIYVKKQSVKVSGRDSILPNTKRIKQITDVATPLLKLNSEPNLTCWIDNMVEIDQPDTRQTLINYRIEFRLYL